MIKIVPEIHRRPRYADQRGHVLRRGTSRFREELGYKPAVFVLEPILRGDINYIRRRSMRKVTRDGR